MIFSLKSYTQCGKTYKGVAVKKIFSIVTTLVVLAWVSPLKALTAVLSGDPQGVISKKSEASFLPPVISTMPGDTAEVVLYVEGLEPIHAFTMSIDDIYNPTKELGVPVRFLYQSHKRGPMIFLPGGGELQNWIIENLISIDEKTSVHSRIEFRVADNARSSCRGIKGKLPVVRCTMSRMDGRYALLLDTIESVSADPKATMAKLMNGQYYGKFPPFGK